MEKVGGLELLFEQSLKENLKNQALVRSARGLIYMVQSDKRIMLYQNFRFEMSQKALHSSHHLVGMNSREDTNTQSITYQ